MAIGDPGPAARRTVHLHDVPGRRRRQPESGERGSVAVGGDGQGGLQRRRQGRPGGVPSGQPRRGATGTSSGGIVPPGSPAFGSGTLDVPFQGDLDGDGKTDLILYRPSTSQWFVQQSSKGFVAVQRSAAAGDIPVVADFDGVGHSRAGGVSSEHGPVVRGGSCGRFATVRRPGGRPADAAELQRDGRGRDRGVPSGDGSVVHRGPGAAIGFGGPGDVPIPMYNYTATVATRWRCSVRARASGSWRASRAAISFGGAGDVPMAGDFDGTGSRRARGVPSGHGPVVRGGPRRRVSRLRRPDATSRWRRRTCTVRRAEHVGNPAGSRYAPTSATPPLDFATRCRDPLGRVGLPAGNAVRARGRSRGHDQARECVKTSKVVATGLPTLNRPEPFTTRPWLPSRAPWATAATAAVAANRSPDPDSPGRALPQCRRAALLSLRLPMLACEQSHIGESG